MEGEWTWTGSGSGPELDNRDQVYLSLEARMIEWIKCIMQIFVSWLKSPKPVGISVLIALKEPGNKSGHVRNIGHIVTSLPPGLAVYKVIKVPLFLVDVLKPWVNIIELLRVNNGICSNAPITFWKYILLLLLKIIEFSIFSSIIIIFPPWSDFG